MKKSRNKLAVMMAIAMASSVLAGCGDTNSESGQTGGASSGAPESSAQASSETGGGKCRW